MNHRLWIGVGGFLAIVAIGGYVERGMIRDAWMLLQRPELPVAEPAKFYPPPTTTRSPQAPTIVVSSTKPGTVVTPPRVPSAEPVDPFADRGPLPAQVNLAVPFLSQAPKQNWSMPYQEACEEASMLMVDAFYRGQSQKFTPSAGDEAILDLVAFEEARGKTPDLTAAEVSEIVSAKWGYQAIVSNDVSPERVKRALANGYPVILPADGKQLANPNFRNGGPPYHMLVIKGYIGNKTWITNDPGTRLGADFTYPYEHLLSVSRDWNGGDVPHGRPVLIVLIPRVQ
jgi:hypothetical protein